MSVTMQVVTITPEMAEKFLENNRSNRPKRPETIREYAGQMLSGNWALNGETVKITPDGSLLDGQHRMEACVRTNMPFVTCLATVDTPNVFDTIDVGRKRTGADTFYVKGETNPVILASVLRVLYEYMQEGKLSDSYSATPPRVLIETLNKHPDIRKYVTYASAHRSKLFNPTVISFCHYVFSRIDSNDADTFIRRVIDGEGLSRGDPVYALREKMLEERLISKKTRNTIRNFYGVALVFKAWNAFRKDREIKQMRYLLSEPFPVPK